MNVFEYNFLSLTGASINFHNYQGQPMLIVNTASYCSYTPQYRKLQNLWRDYKEGGLMVIAMPSNDFGEQEPAEEDIIDQFLRTNYGVDFPVTAKQVVSGRDAHPLFIKILEEHGIDAMPKWNFQKYLFDRTGDLLDFWPSAVEPDDPVITHHIERHLQSWIL